jgi:tetratricopeptide (TPR) repeat protein
MKTKRSLFLAALMLLAALPVFGQAGMGEIRGKVTDADGNPLAGVEVTFSSTVNDTAVYTAKTNKKGRFLRSGIVYYHEGRWKVTVDHEDYVPVWVHIESRTQTALVDKFDKDLKPGTGIPLFYLRAFGKGVIDIKLAPAGEVASAEGAIPGQSGSTANAAAVMPKDPWQLATTLVSQGRLEDSLPQFAKAVNEEPENLERRVAYAKVLYQQTKYGDALQQATKATELNPQSLEANMVLYSIHVASENLAAAASSLDQALELAPDDLRVLNQIAFLADRSDDPEKAIGAYEKITEVEPDNVDAWVALGGLYADTGRMQESAKAYEKVGELDPANAHQAFYNLGVLLMNKQNASAADSKRAVQALMQAVEIKDDYPLAWQKLGYAKLGIGDIAGAVSALEKYVELSPNAKDAAEVKSMAAALKQ